jgi:hypothetical protein
MGPQADPRIVHDAIEGIAPARFTHLLGGSVHGLVACHVDLDEQHAVGSIRPSPLQSVGGGFAASAVARAEEHECVVCLLEDSLCDGKSNSFVRTCDQYSSHAYSLFAPDLYQLSVTSVSAAPLFVSVVSVYQAIEIIASLQLNLITTRPRSALPPKADIGCGPSSAHQPCNNKRKIYSS